MNERLTDMVAFEPKRLPIDSADGVQLTQFMLYGKPMSGQAYPNHFNLGIYTGTMMDLYADAKKVYILDPELRKNYAQAVAEDIRNYPQLQKIVSSDPSIVTSFFDKVNEQDSGERTTVLYRDPKTGKIANTPIQHGEYTRVSRYDLGGILRTGGQPFMEIHTHPEDQLFSPKDYFTMISPIKGKSPEIRGAIVLCPSIQLMAVVTGQTPVMGTTDARILTDEWKRKIRGEDEEINKIWQRLRKTKTEHDAYIAANLQKVLNSAVFQAMESRNQLTRRERRVLQRNTEKEYRQLKFQKAQYESAENKLMSEYAEVVNARLLEFARTLNITLYISRNSQDFYKFAA